MCNLKRGLALTATIVASGMGFIDGTVVHIVLPAIQQDFGAGFAELQWIANAYLLALCALMVISGALGDRYGPRRVFLLGIGGFILSSIGCAAAADSHWLIIARSLQGISAALMLPQSLSIIARLYPPDKRGSAVGIWSASASASAAAGPVVGGFLIDSAGWPYAFWVNVPLGLLALFLTIYAVPGGNDRKRVALDWQGSCLLAIGLGAAVFSIINLSLFSVSSIYVWPGWVIGLCALVAFVWWERRAIAPILPAHFIANREFVLLNFYCLSAFAAFAAVMFLVPYLMITSLGFTASQTAMNMLPLGICISLMARPAGAWADRAGYRMPLILGAIGIALATASAGLLVWLRTPWAGAVVMASLGISAGLMVTPLTTGVLNSVDTQESGLASGINHAVTRIGSLLSIALSGAALALRYKDHLRESLSAKVDAEQLSLIEPVALKAVDAMAQADLTELPAHLQLLVRSALTDALDIAFVEVMIAISMSSLLAAWCASYLNEGRTGLSESASAKKFML